jgi:serine/threonine-protein kinase
MERILKSKYKILDKIFEDPSSITYKGEHVDQAIPLVIKIFRRNFLNSTLIKKIKKDIPPISRLSHPSIPRLLDGDYGWQGFYFIREFVDGTDISSMEKPFDALAACDIAAKVCEALSVAHSNGICHGNLTPNNVFVGTDKNIKVTDFGIKALVFSSHEKKASLLLEDNARYMSPEEIMGEDPAPASDIYKTGLLIYYMLTGKLPFTGKNNMEIAVKRIKESPVPPSSVNSKVPRFLDDIVLKCLETEPLLRFESAGQLKESLDNKAVITPKRIEIETQNIAYAPAEKNAGKTDEKQEDIFAEPENVRTEGKTNLLRWIFIAVLIAAATGIIYSLVQIFITGD